MELLGDNINNYNQLKIISNPNEILIRFYLSLNTHATKQICMFNLDKCISYDETSINICKNNGKYTYSTKENKCVCECKLPYCGDFCEKQWKEESEFIFSHVGPSSGRSTKMVCK